MERLNKQITASFYKDADGYSALKSYWSRLMRDKERRKSLATGHHLLYLILRGKNWQKAFMPMTNSVKLENGGFSNWRARKALLQLHSVIYAERLLMPFAAFLHPDALCAIRELVPPLEWNASPLDREPYHG